MELNMELIIGLIVLIAILETMGGKKPKP
jgi:hypothetical protein